MMKTSTPLLLLLLCFVSCSLEPNIDQLFNDKDALILRTYIDGSVNNTRFQVIEVHSDLFQKLRAIVDSKAVWESSIISCAMPKNRIASRTFTVSVYDDFMVLNQGEKQWTKKIDSTALNEIFTKADDIHLVGEYYGHGKLHKDSYTFCSTVPTTVHYQYKKGKWTFWNRTFEKIASGEFDVQYETIHTNCEGITRKEYSSINKEHWNFYATNDTGIPSLIHKLETD